MKKSRSAVVGTDEEVAVACQLPETSAFPRGRSLGEPPPQLVNRPIKATTAQNSPRHRHAAILIRPKDSRSLVPQLRVPPSGELRILEQEKGGKYMLTGSHREVTTNISGVERSPRTLPRMQ